MSRSRSELEVKLAELLAVDAREGFMGMVTPAIAIGAKVGAVKAILWALGDDDDSWHVTAAPGPLVAKLHGVQ